MEEWGWVVRRVGENEGRGGRESECYVMRAGGICVFMQHLVILI